MNATYRTTIQTLAGPIGQNETWLLCPMGGSIRLAPIGFFPERWLDTSSDNHDVILLSDLGYLRGERHDVTSKSVSDFDRPISEIVLLLPEELAASVAALREQALATVDGAAVGLFSEEWLPTSYHFCGSSEPTEPFPTNWSPATGSVAGPLARNGKRRLVFGSLPSSDVNVPWQASGAATQSSDHRNDVFAH
jgi:hypothetical protein